MSSRTQRPPAPPPAAAPKKTRKVADSKVAQANTGASTGASTEKAQASKDKVSKTAKAQTSTASDEGTGCAFLYGTLMMPEVFYKTIYGTTDPPEATRKLHPFQPAMLDGYQRLRVMDVVYPGIIPLKGRKVYGTLVSGLTKAHIQKLDRYEGDQYDRKSVTVNLVKRLGGGNLADAGKAVADVYVFKFPQELDTTDWDPVEFRREYMADWTR
ncbi:AIG2-like family-domain-containing protein [Chaetomium tenue]|uniref:AIG2-like family-domain-containing protein n=1 Tax=Chaetomium tenue TaxID=1854479 RepID=A0ACB7P2Q5_9PEZI|nr:AIG2-like family-domain-containing protein [Chaetomium globosum]